MLVNMCFSGEGVIASMILFRAGGGSRLATPPRQPATIITVP